MNRMFAALFAAAAGLLSPAPVDVRAVVVDMPLHLRNDGPVSVAPRGMRSGKTGAVAFRSRSQKKRRIHARQCGDV